MAVDNLDSLEATALLAAVAGEATCNNALAAPAVKASTTRMVPTAAASSSSVVASLAQSLPKVKVKVVARLQQPRLIFRHHHLSMVVYSFRWAASRMSALLYGRAGVISASLQCVCRTRSHLSTFATALLEKLILISLLIDHDTCFECDYYYLWHSGPREVRDTAPKELWMT
jgi:hypothetical protein